MAESMKTPTPAQERALKVFETMILPSLEEWARELGVSYTTVLHHRRNLVDKGYLTSIPGKARTTQLTDKALEFLGGGGND